MSYYYTYYIGYMSENKIYPLGPYSATGELKSVISKSASFASDLHRDFLNVLEDRISDELKKEFSYENWNGETVMERVKYLPVKDLPKDSFVKSGYFLIEDVIAYENDSNSEELFYEHVSPTVYAALLQHEAQFGKPAPKKDEEGYEIPVYSASDYMYYTYPDYNCKEYEADLLRTVAYMLGEFDLKLPKGYELVVLETEG